MRILPDQLPKLSGIAQCVDSQWAPIDVLLRAGAEKQPVSHYAERLQAATKAEFFKSLLLLESVVVNRAYLLENPTLKEMYLGKSINREAFEQLLAEGAIVPFFANEHSLADDYSISPLSEEVRRFWANLENENAVRRLRLSWDDRECSAKLHTQLVRRFGDFFKTIDGLDRAKLVSDFGLHGYSDETLRKALIALRDFANQISDTENRWITRSDVYRKFVCVEGSDDFRIDGEKPLALPIKALTDLKYNVNLPDALNRYVVTSQGSIGRESLQEIRLLGEGNKIHSVDQGELSSLLESVARLGLDEISRTAELTDVHSVELQDVMAVRADPIWRMHSEISLDNLPDPSKSLKDQAFVKNPMKAMTDISTSLGRLVERLADKTKDRKTAEVEQKCEVVVQAVGAFEMVVSWAGTHILGLPEAGVDRPTKRALEQMMVPLVAHAVVSWKGPGVDYEIRQPVFQGKVWAETAQIVARELQDRLSFHDLSVGAAELQGGGIEVKDQDD